jgi:hypothetical protein
MVVLLLKSELIEKGNNWKILTLLLKYLSLFKTLSASKIAKVL